MSGWRHTFLAAMIAALGLVGCGKDPVTVIIVTVEARPAVPPTETLAVTVGNNNATVTETLDVRGREFPLTFTVTTPGRTGEITFDLEGRDPDGRITSRATGTGTLVADTESTTSVRLDPEDFVVNGSTPGDQRLTFVPERAGRQLAANGDGSFVISFINDCAQLGRCDVFARLFDERAQPETNDTTQDSRELIVNQVDQFALEPATTASSAGTFIAWATAEDVRVSLLSPTGEHMTNLDQIVSTAINGDSPSVAALSEGRFVVVWTEFDGVSGDVVRGRLYGPAGMPVTNPATMNASAFDVSTLAGGEPRNPVVAATGDGLGFAVVWFDGETLYARFFGADGLPRPTTQVQLAAYGTSADVYGPRVTWADGAAVVLWGVRALDPPGLDKGVWIMRRFAAPIGAPDGSEIIISRTTPDVYSMPSITTRSDGAVGLAWHKCGSEGDGAGCGIFARIYRPTGLPVGEVVAVNTTTRNNQLDPSIGSVPDGFVITWSDESGDPPDTSPAAVRARVIYPEYETNDGRIGARCGRPDDEICGANLTCFAGSEGAARCHPSCDPTGPVPHCPDGGVCTGTAGMAACVF